VYVPFIAVVVLVCVALPSITTVMAVATPFLYKVIVNVPAALAALSLIHIAVTLPPLPKMN
jgi:hypothetical protein